MGEPKFDSWVEQLLGKLTYLSAELPITGTPFPWEGGDQRQKKKIKVFLERH